jgi:hypothetical protein
MLKHSTPTFRLIRRLLFVFLLLSLADLFLTWKLIHAGDGRVLESNPVAGWWLTSYGWAGMAAFKLATVVLVGGLAGTIAYWRPRTSELLLVFACGALSTVVLSSALLARSAEGEDTPPPVVQDYGSPSGGGSHPPHFSGFLPDNPLLLLLAQKSVQEELQLSEVLVLAISQFSGDRQALAQGFRGLNPGERHARVQPLLAQEKTLLEELDPPQAKRLRQIAWQQRGLLAVIEPEVSGALQLTEQQERAVWTLAEEARNARAAAPRVRRYEPDGPRPAEESNRVQEQLGTILTAEQMTRWKELIGEPFKGELRPRFAGMYGPPGRELSRPR